MHVVAVGNRGDGNLRLIGLIGLGPASRVFTCSLLDRLLTATVGIRGHMGHLVDGVEAV